MYGGASVKRGVAGFGRLELASKEPIMERCALAPSDNG